MRWGAELCFGGRSASSTGSQEQLGPPSSSESKKGTEYTKEDISRTELCFDECSASSSGNLELSGPPLSSESIWGAEDSTRKNGQKKI